MILDEAIEQCYRIIHNKTVEAETLKDGYEVFAQDCLEDAEVHRQLAKWLTDLKVVYEILDTFGDSDEIAVGYLRERIMPSL